MATQVAEIVKGREGALTQLNETLAALIQRGGGMEVKDAASDLEAKQFKVEVKSYEKAVDLFADGDIQDAKERLSKLQGAKKMLLAPLQSVLEVVERKRRTWEEDERRKAEAEQRRLQEEARKAAEARAAEQRKLDEAAAAERRKAEQKAIEEARKAGELNKREAERAKREAGERERQAKEQAARDAEAAKNDVPEVKVQAAIPALAGTVSRRLWKFRIIDSQKLPREYLMPNEAKIGQDVRTWKKSGEVIPGVEAYSE